MNPEFADELLTTTRAVRKRLDLDRDVPMEIVEKCIELAIQAPSATNMQSWRWMVVTEAGRRKSIAEIYRRTFELMYREQDKIRMRNMTPEDAARHARVSESATHLAENFERVPVLVIPCLLGRLPSRPPGTLLASFFGSIYPAVWSFQLALRSRGLGSVLTTLHLAFESEVAEVLGIPESVTQVGLLPVAYIKGDTFKPAPRRPVSEVTYLDQWQRTR